jgi:hypothetical protein
MGVTASEIVFDEGQEMGDDEIQEEEKSKFKQTKLFGD